MKAARPKISARPDKRPPPDRSKLDHAERDLDAAKRDLAARLAEPTRRRAELEVEERTVRLEGEARVFELERARDTERSAYERAAGQVRGSARRIWRPVR